MVAPFAAFALLTAVAGCSHIAEVRESDPGFTADALRAGGLVIMGVVQVNEVTQVRPPLIAALERVLTATRGDIPLVPASRAAAALDDSTGRLLLLSYQMHATPEPQWLNRAAEALLSLGRYGVLARVDSDRTRYATRDAPPTDVSLQSATGMILVTGRDVKVSVQVYDLKTRTRVFEGAYIGTAEAAVADSMGIGLEPKTPLGPLTTSPDPQPNPVQQPYPKPRPLANALEPAFLEFARSLPGAPTPH